MEKIIRKSKINWLVTDTAITAFDKIQATCYHAYDSPNKFMFEEMKKKVLKSKDDEFNSWVDIMDYAVREKVNSYGTRVKPEWFE